MLRAAGELRRRLPILRHISDRHVRSILREFFLAGWTIADVQLAIDRKPTEQLWPHDGAHGVGNIGAWFAHRLAAWRTTDGTVRRSPSQQRATEAAEQRARSRARREAEQQVRNQIAANSQQVEDTRARVQTWWHNFRSGRTTEQFSGSL